MGSDVSGLTLTTTPPPVASPAKERRKTMRKITGEEMIATLNRDYGWDNPGNYLGDLLTNGIPGHGYVYFTGGCPAMKGTVAWQNLPPRITAGEGWDVVCPSSEVRKMVLRKHLPDHI